MANWFYYNEQGEKIQVTGGQLKGLAKAGMITPETIVETEEGKTAPARKVKGLTFGETVQSKTPKVPVVTKDDDVETRMAQLLAEPVQPKPIETNPHSFTAEEQEEINRFLAVEARQYGNQALFDWWRARYAETVQTGDPVDHTGVGRLLAMYEVGNVNAVDEYGWTLLHRAAELGKLEIVKYLVSMGASVNAKTATGRTPLDIAMEKGNMPVIQYLTSVRDTGTAEQPPPFTLGLGFEKPPSSLYGSDYFAKQQTFSIRKRLHK